ncbi:choice-of-anchor D domain-containing protein [Sorangium sp. So ce1153]|uniref:choice-of-anchor D domain-containing protein n=1 Tax=Sorangium sp. So ce1153 TaxID=3133333 RepID=UPI003F5FBF73
MTSIQPNPASTDSASSLTFSPAALRFGPVPAGAADVRVVVVQNGTDEAVSLALDPGTAEFSVLGDTTTVDAGQEAELFLQYQSAAEGAHRATLTATGLSGELGRCTLSGTTIPSLTIDPGAIAFGDVPVGQSRVEVLFVTNATGSDVELVLSPEVGGTFTISPARVPSTSVPTLIVVTYVPDAIGPAQATLRLSGSPLSASLSGTGVVPSDLDFVDADAQRFKVEVPFDHARLFLGAGVTSSPAGTFSNVDGCGLDADSNIYLSARNGRILAQAGGDVFLQADGGEAGDGFAQLHQQGSSGKAILSSNGTAYVAGKGGVTISAGVKVARDDGATFDSTPDTGTIDALAISFTAFDMLVASKLAWDAMQSYWEDRAETPRAKQFLEIAAAAAAVAAPVLGGLSAAALVPGVTLFGAGGISIFSPAYTVVHGVAGLALVSMYPTIFGLVDAGIWAGDDVGITASTGSVKVFGSKSVNVHSAEKVSIEASTNKHQTGGTIELKGHTIAIGRREGSAQEPRTSLIFLEAAKLLQIDVGATEAEGNIELGVGDNKLRITHAGIEIEAKKFTVLAGNSYLQLSDTDLTLNFKDGGQLVLNQESAALERGGAGAVILSQGKAVLQHTKDSRLRLDANGLNFKGKKHNLGA